MNFQFINTRKYWYSLSGLLVLVSVIALVTWGLKLGIDFTGGTLMEIQFNDHRPATQSVQEKLAALDLGSINIQSSGEDVMLLRLRDITEEEHQEVLQILKTNYANVPPPEAADLPIASVITELRFESVGPVIGQELKEKSYLAIILTLIFIILYIAYAFRKVSYPVASWKYGITAIIALAHDIIIVCGVFAVLGHFLNWEINVLFITALLTTLGYSVNDSIVVFDRTRENLYHHKDLEFGEVVNESINQTMARSINTSFTTLLVLLAIFFFGGASINQFVMALIAGVLIGTYSSIFVASPLLIEWFKFGKK